ncbi:peptidase domain-containing ABC transporter [Empedobacter falsenii]
MKNYKTYLLYKFKENFKIFNNLGILIFIITLLQAITPFLFRVIIDLGVNKDNIPFINIIFIGYFMLLLSIGIGNIIKNYLSHILTSEFKKSIIIDYIKIILNHISSVTILNFGQLYNKINDLEFLNTFLTKNTLYFINSLLMTIIYSSILYVFNVEVFLVFIAYIIISFIWEYLFISYKKIIETKIRESKIEEKNYWFDLLGNIYDIKIYNKEKEYISKWNNNNDEYEKSIYKDSLTKSGQEFISFLISSFKNLFILYISIREVLNGEMTFGTLISIQFIIGFLNSPVASFINFISSYGLYKISINEINNDYVNFISTSNEGKIVLKKEINLIDLYNISLIYPKSPSYSLTNINLKLYRGKKYAIIGKSGSGKSTLLKVLLGLYSPTEGVINIDRLSSMEINMESYRNNFASVLQESKLIKGNFIENITFHSTDIDYDWLNKVIDLTNLEDILSKYKKGIFDNINNESKGISEGQKQRILLARALYQNKDFLILDEATNALDVYNEFVIFNNLKKIMNDKTLIVSTHNINLIKDFDCIFFMLNGTIVEVGNHEQLTKKKGHYNIFYNIQNKNQQ